MPRGPAPGWRERKPPITDDYIYAAIEQAGGLGAHHPETGEYATMVLRGFADREEALEWQRSLYRCALFLHKRRNVPVSMSVKMIRDGKGWALRYRVGDKTLARQYHLNTHGHDNTKWAYNPRNRGWN
jgi:hypothetical protein